MGIEAFRKLSYGLYVVSSLKDGQINGQIANALFQVTSNPPAVAVSIKKENLTHNYIQASRKFSISILSQNAPMTFIGLFGFRSGKTINKFEGVNYKSGRTGVPVVLQPPEHLCREIPLFRSLVPIEPQYNRNDPERYQQS